MDCYSFLLSPFPSFYHILLANGARSFIRGPRDPIRDLAIRSSSLSQLSRRAVLSWEEIFPSKSPISRPNNNRPHVLVASCTRCPPRSSFSRFADSHLGMASTRLLSSHFALCHRPRLQSYCIDEGKLLSTAVVQKHRQPQIASRAISSIEIRVNDCQLFMVLVEQFAALITHLIVKREEREHGVYLKLEN